MGLRDRRLPEYSMQAATHESAIAGVSATLLRQVRHQSPEARVRTRAGSTGRSRAGSNGVKSVLRDLPSAINSDIASPGTLPISGK
jgi:hypothetical protein